MRRNWSTEEYSEEVVFDGTLGEVGYIYCYNWSVCSQKIRDMNSESLPYVPSTLRLVHILNFPLSRST
jgi:hypothetical protein